MISILKNCKIITAAVTIAAASASMASGDKPRSAVQGGDSGAPYAEGVERNEGQSVPVGTDHFSPLPTDV